ncbi:hypothetical protein BSF_15220 [Bacillus subtilis]|nr:hypothetical protein BSF_15220 [Bacillus subtilis]
MYGYHETAADLQTNLKIKKKPEISQAFQFRHYKPTAFQAASTFAASVEP